MTTLGLLAGTFTTLSFLPQVLLTLRRGSAADISGGWLALFATGIFSWLVYGLLRSDPAIAISNGVTFALVLVIVVVKLRSVGAPAT